MFRRLEEKRDFSHDVRVIPTRLGQFRGLKPQRGSPTGEPAPSLDALAQLPRIAPTVIVKPRGVAFVVCGLSQERIDGRIPTGDAGELAHLLTPMYVQMTAPMGMTIHVRMNAIVCSIRFPGYTTGNRLARRRSQTRLETLENERRRTVVSRTVHRSQTATVLCPLGRYAP